MAWILGIASLIIGCGAHVAAGPSSPEASSGPRLAMDRADILASRGDHLAASRYYEAALAGGADEETVLPRLIVQLVRGGRLLAALDSTSRLTRISRSPEQARALHRLIEDLIGYQRHQLKE